MSSDHNPQCSFCNGAEMSLVIDFGQVALAGAFLTEAQFAAEQRYPLRVYFCHDCYAVQVTDKVSEQTLFQDYFYFSSSIGTLRDHFAQYAVEVTSRFVNPDSATVIEFGCNDGVLLRPLADQGIRTVIGVDPATNVVSSIDDERVEIVNDFFGEPVAAQIVEKYGKADLVMANNVYAHIPDIRGITRAVRDVLADDGVFVFEVHYLGKVVSEMQYDMIYHEHLYYYSLLSAIEHFAQYDMVVFDIKEVPIHAGSIRFYVCKKESRYANEISSAVEELKRRELDLGFDKFETFRGFSRRVAAHRDELMKVLLELNAAGNKVAGYGASGRANTMIQWCGIGEDHIRFMIDDAPAKAGYFTPGSHLKIHPSTILQGDDAPDYLLIFAWSFFDEIRKRNVGYLEQGGNMILPLPEVKLFSGAQQ